MQAIFTCINLRWHLLLLLQLCCWLIRGLLWPYELKYTSQNRASIWNFFQVGDTKTYIDRNLICVRKSISILVEKVISDGQWCFFSVLLGPLHRAPSYLFIFFILKAISYYEPCPSGLNEKLFTFFSLFSAIALDKH